MANIIKDIEKKVALGYDLIDKDGNFCKSEALTKRIFDEYKKSVKLGTTDPIKTSFEKFYEEAISEEYVDVTELFNELSDILENGFAESDGEYEEEEEEESRTDID